MNKKIEPIGIILIIACAILTIGVKTYFSACEVTEEHTMSCHWAEQAVFGVSIVLLVQAICAVFMGLDAPNIRKGISIAMVPTAILAVVIPGYLINLCMMDTMQCRATMKPSVMVMGFVIAVLASIYATPGGFLSPVVKDKKSENKIKNSGSKKNKKK